MWKEINAEGFLVYPNFIDTVTKLIPMYWVRLMGGLLFLTGALLLAYNFIKTVGQGSPLEDEEVEVPDQIKDNIPAVGHAILEKKPLIMAGLALVVISIGSLFELIPTFLVKTNVPTISSVKPYTPLELYGRDIYLREGCYNCHSQMVRPFRDEVLRYGPYSKAGEFIYDHPFQWGSRRIGPDLHREGGKYPHLWHYRHFMNPQEVISGSIMPRYTWFAKYDIEYHKISNRMKAMQTVGVPYSDEEIALGSEAAKKQAKTIASDLQKAGVQNIESKEMLAIIAYIQRLGTDIGWRE
jgi:cytochrome c oxidase cbb3-type subunit I/II